MRNEKATDADFVEIIFSHANNFYTSISLKPY